MASQITIYSIYKIIHLNAQHDKYLLIKTIRPGYSNCNAAHVELSLEIEQSKRNALLLNFIRYQGYAVNTLTNLLGEFHSEPSGNLELHSSRGLIDVTISYVNTSYGFPWVILGGFENGTDLLNELSECENYEMLNPIGQPTTIKAVLVTENDFHLSNIKDYDVRNIE